MIVALEEEREASRHDQGSCCNLAYQSSHEADEQDSTSESTPLIEKQDHAGKKLNKIDFDQAFVIISFIGLLVEAASSAFNLASTHIFVSDRIKHIVAIAFYIICALVALSMIISSALAIKKSINEKKVAENSPEALNEKNLSTSKLLRRQSHIQISENSLTIISQVMWIVVSAASLIMLSIGDNPALEQLSLILSVTAPFLGVASCILRLSDSAITRKTSRSEAERRRARNFMILCAVILVFEAVHCACHIVEAISLGGRMQDIYSFQDTAVLCLELLTVIAFIAAVFIEKYIDSKAEKSQHDVCPNSTLDNDSNDIIYPAATLSEKVCL